MAKLSIDGHNLLRLLSFRAEPWPGNEGPLRRELRGLSQGRPAVPDHQGQDVRPEVQRPGHP